MGSGWRFQRRSLSFRKARGYNHYISNARFSDFISFNGLMDIPMDGGLYTWSNSNSCSRLDWFLFTSSVEEHFTMVIQRRLP